MWIEKNLFATCSSGLCNRLLVLAGSLRIAARTGRKLALYWPANQDLGCRFEDLFNNSFPMVTETEWKVVLDTTITVKIYNAWKTQGPIFRAIRADGDPDTHLVIIKGWSYPMFEGEGYSDELNRELRQILLTLKPRPEIQAAVEAFALPKDCLGVHVRRGDHIDEFGESSDDHFLAVMRGVQSRRPGVKFFFATDVAETERRFRDEFGDALLCAPKQWPGRDNVQGGREGLIDLILLSRTAAILGNIHSSFSQTAGLLGNKRMIVADHHSAGARLDETCDLLAGCLSTDCLAPVPA